MYQPMCVGLQKKYSFYATEEGTFPITAFSGVYDHFYHAERT